MLRGAQSIKENPDIADNLPDRACNCHARKPGEPARVPYGRAATRPPTGRATRKPNENMQANRTTAKRRSPWRIALDTVLGLFGASRVPASAPAPAASMKPRRYSSARRNIESPQPNPKRRARRSKRRSPPSISSRNSTTHCASSTCPMRASLHRLSPRLSRHADAARPRAVDRSRRTERARRACACERQARIGDALAREVADLSDLRRTADAFDRRAGRARLRARRVRGLALARQRSEAQRTRCTTIR